MSVILLSVTGVFVLLGVVFAVLFTRVSSRSRNAAIPADWDVLHVASRYKPMERLLDPLDCRFLESEPGYNRRMARRLRAKRVEIFRGYARCLGRDFARVSSALKLLMVHAAADRSALAGVLLKQQFLFSMNMMSLEARVMLHSFGVSAPQIDVRGLVEALDTMRTQLQVLAASAQPAASAA
ncbi:MAG: hypothetical protein LAP39_15260 [Acidobacteriia bacterium]|nr:hypothetical protein [Terriglobia bacterium]